ncbi:GIY-YIG nuclease family protein [Desulfitispora alkaliphila]|uniref:GIY-YIG nuclease family protein n=1 Tax=Desulfitispora alkaliphila TaxID=622674 RepID=UPI003D26169F
MSYFVYLLECSDGTLYTGYTNNINKRLATHNSGKGAKYTRSRLPVKIVYCEEHFTKSAALKREYIIRKMSRQKKEELVKKHLLS